MIAWLNNHLCCMNLVFQIFWQKAADAMTSIRLMPVIKLRAEGRTCELITLGADFEFHKWCILGLFLNHTTLHTSCCTAVFSGSLSQPFSYIFLHYKSARKGTMNYLRRLQEILVGLKSPKIVLVMPLLGEKHWVIFFCSLSMQTTNTGCLQFSQTSMAPFERWGKWEVTCPGLSFTQLMHECLLMNF